jgi:midasin (ATPase involved in ribosome maturation)
MDPRNGELSRAMRNRAIELFVPVDVSTINVLQSTSSTLESKMHRFSHLTQYSSGLSEEMPDTEFHARVVSQLISLEDVPMMSRFQEQLHQGLLGPGKVEVSRQLVNAMNNKHPLWIEKALEDRALSIPASENDSYLQVCLNSHAVKC